MSTITEYARLSAKELAELKRLLADDHEEAYEFVSELTALDFEGDDGSPPRATDTDKAWAGLQFLMSGLRPPVDMICGGKQLTDEVWAYDAPRLLDPGQVAAAADFLAQTPFDRLAERYDAAALNAAEVYPEGWDEEGSELDYLASHYDSLTAFFAGAKDSGDSVLVWMS